MTFIIQEQSIDDSNPIELYKFVGTISNFHFTSSNRQYTYDGATYVTEAIDCDEIVLGDVTESNELSIRMPTANPLVQTYGLDIPPPSLRLTIYRVHPDTGHAAIWFEGSVSGIAVEGESSTLTVPSNVSLAMTSEFPGAFYQGPCGRALYDTRCGVSRTAHQVAGTISAVLDRRTVSVDELLAKPDQWAKGGELVTSTERRLVLDQVGAQVILNYPFRDLAEGSSVTVFAGCDRTALTCQSKFNNLVNFFGFPYTPSLNPFLKQPGAAGTGDGGQTDTSNTGGGTNYVAPVASSVFPANSTEYTVGIAGLTDLPVAGRSLTVRADGSVVNNPTSYVTPSGSARWIEVNQIVQTRLRKMKGFTIPWPAGAVYFASPNTAGVWQSIPAGSDMGVAGGGIVATVQDDGSFTRTGRVQTRAA